MSQLQKRSPAANQSVLSRRTLLGGMAGAAAGAMWPLPNLASAAQRKGRIKQSVCLWCYDAYRSQHNMGLDQFAAACAKMGLLGIDLTTPDQWPTLKKHGLICTITPSHDIPKGLNRLENHDECLAKIRKSIDHTAAAGFPNVICFSGNRAGMDDREGLKNCVTARSSGSPPMRASGRKSPSAWNCSTRSTTRTIWPTRPAGAWRWSVRSGRRG